MTRACRILKTTTSRSQTLKFTPRFPVSSGMLVHEITWGWYLGMFLIGPLLPDSDVVCMSLRFFPPVVVIRRSSSWDDRFFFFRVSKWFGTVVCSCPVCV